MLTSDGRRLARADLLTSRQAKPGGVLERPAGTSGRAYHQDRAVGVTDHRVGDVTHEGASHPSEPAAADHYHTGVDFFGEVYDRLVPLFVHLQMGDRDLAARLLDLRDLVVEDLLRLPPEIFATRLGVFVVDGGGKSTS